MTQPKSVTENFFVERTERSISKKLRVPADAVTEAG
jgi:hypothetical protein